MCTIEAVQSSWLASRISCCLTARTDTKPCLGVIITDQEYPVRPAFSLLTKLLDDFIARIPQTAFSNPSAISFPEINTYLSKYQDPRQADAIMRVQQELDETKIVLVRSLQFLFLFYF